ncbi:MAG: ABC transporter substrate-binding protein [Actinophytocola sp.]|nr:ABC transporter substrate-binding protein [Actinophytocola sp.]
MSGLSRPTRTSRRLVRPWRCSAAAIGGVALLLFISACGSQLDPATVARAQGHVLGGQQGVTGSQPGSGSDPANLGPGKGATADAGGNGSGPQATSANGSGPAPGDVAGSGKNSASGSVDAASCAGFENQTGITDKKITVANIADISGPIPGLFESAQQSARAYVAYFNATNPEGICGRELDVLTIDGRSETAGDQQGYTRACEEAFAAVGSMVADDSGGAKPARSAGCPTCAR